VSVQRIPYVLTADHSATPFDRGGVNSPGPRSRRAIDLLGRTASPSRSRAHPELATIVAAANVNAVRKTFIPALLDRRAGPEPMSASVVALLCLNMSRPFSFVTNCIVEPASFRGALSPRSNP
jgi:hypothetical protein